MLKVGFYLLVMATLVVAIIFLALNYAPVSVKYGLGEVKVSLSILLCGVFFVGILFGVGFEAFVIMRQRAHIKRLEKEKQAVETEISNLRNMPMKDLR